MRKPRIRNISRAGILLTKANIRNTIAVVENTLVASGIINKHKVIHLKEDIIFDYKREKKNLYILEHILTRLVIMAESLKELQILLAEELEFLYEEFVLDKEYELTPIAKEIRLYLESKVADVEYANNIEKEWNSKEEDKAWKDL